MNNAIDNAITIFDRALRSTTKGTQTASRACPSPKEENTSEMNDIDRKHSAGLMRVNHSGEVCAQALYQGQALTAKLSSVKDEMETAANEEIDHLAWCEHRLEDLNSQPSILNPLWYGLSFGVGASAGLISDKISLGFVAATEDLVCKHLEEHLESLPTPDVASKAIVCQMLTDEQKHAHSAINAGGIEFPSLIKYGMSWVSKLMTTLSYRI